MSAIDLEGCRWIRAKAAEAPKTPAPRTMKEKDFSAIPTVAQATRAGGAVGKAINGHRSLNTIMSDPQTKQVLDLCLARYNLPAAEGELAQDSLV